MNSVVPGLSSVVFDTQGGYTDAIEYLSDAGHRRVAYVAGPKASWADKERQRSIRAAAAGRDLTVDILGAGPATFDRGVSIAAELASKKYTAVLAFDDIIALGILRGCRDAGVRVPDDLAVLGCDNIELDLVSDPGLATIATPVEDAARYAVDLAIARASTQGPPAAQTVTLGGVFIRRASIG
jgi:DNA-binding LacI/PurR family transcriptional regulator